MATSPSVGAFGDSQGNDDDLGDFFEKLDLHEDEFNDVVVKEEAPELLEEIRWIALARVHTPKLFSQTAFYKDMRAAWNCSQQVRFRPIGPNLFVVQVYCLGDWDRIMQQGPWLFRNMAVMIASYDEFTRAENVPMFNMPIWLQIHKLSDGCCRHDLIVKLMRSAGEVLETWINGNSRGDYVRVRINHDIRKPLTKFVSIVKDKMRHIFAVRYEKLARFCSACGVIAMAPGTFHVQQNPSPPPMDQFADMDLDKLSRKRLMNPKAVTMQDAVEDIAVRDGIMLLTDKPSDAPDESSVAGCSKRAKTVWPLPPRTDIKCTGKEWLFHFLLEVPESIHSRIIMVLWRIWYLRNEVVHGKMVPPLDISCSFLASYYNSYKNISLSVEDTVKGKTPVMELLPPAPAPVRMVKKWPAPNSNMVALSTDGSFNLEDGTAGSGMILRNCQGDVIFASYRKLFQCNDALESELQAIKEGLQLAFIHASSPVVLQSDSAMAINMIATAGYDRSLYGVLVVEIKNLLLNREVTLCKISREQNRVAHCLANFGRSGDSTACWLGRPPPCVTMLVAEDCKSVAV
ncbi:hypothetical protein D1007_18858 [Hordeum vulgare]|nr:hypothetical protein D1007_18858 [Hordeum vulgare]